MLLPISHDKMTVRRLPIVTIVLVVVTLLAHAVASVGDAAREQRAMAAMLEARLLYLQHPELGVCPALAPFVAPAPAEPDALSARAAPDPAYDAACAALGGSVNGLVQRRFGYVPAEPRWTGLVTYLFVHSDWLHVLGNMWFLFLCGLALEDRWGRLAFALYYFAGGAVAAAVHQLLTPDPGAALVGASGAVAASMAAFVVLFARTKIRFVGLRLVRAFTFEAPAYVMLPLWVVVEVAFGVIGASSGTAHWAHVGGFAFGITVAAALRTLGLDRRLDEASDRAALLGDDPRLDTARLLLSRGEAAAAVALLEGLAVEKPDSVHVWQGLRDAATAANDAPAAARAVGRLERLAQKR
ncbi:MAG: rhomboid family protein [Labilithrix sp.]|nr:rhomboid family protein [Labilithrix sp.]